MSSLCIEEIQELMNGGKIVWSQHMVIRMQKRGITSKDIEYCIQGGNIIEQYVDDYPYNSCLILGRDEKSKGIHVICGIGEGQLWMITAYYPDMDEWYDDLITRR